MRRVFPLRPAENSFLVTYDAEELHGKDIKLDEQQSGNDSFRNLDSPARLKRRNERKSDTISSGDENLPATAIKKGSTAKPASIPKPPRVSAYPVFTGGRCPGSRTVSLDKGGEESRSPYAARHRFATLASSTASVSQGGLAAKEIYTDKSSRSHERPRSNPKDRSLVDSSPQPAANFRSSSMRLVRLPDSVVRLQTGEEELENARYAVSDGRFSFPPSQATSERSYCGSSDSSSCFTKTADGSSSSSVVSVSSNSKKDSVSGKQRNCKSPFRYLSARVVAEKLVKVLGKEKLRSESSRTNSPQNRVSNKKDAGGVAKEDCEAPCKDTALEPLPVLSSPALTSRRVSYICETSPNEHCLSSGKGGLVAPFMLHDHEKDCCRVTKASSFGRESDAGVFQSLEARALAREELAVMLEHKPWEDKFITVGRCDRVLESSGDRDAQNIDFMNNEISTLRKERRELALELAAEIRTRIAEQKSASDALRRTRLEMESQLRGVEKDRASVQESLERELERREKEWAAKLDKMKIEEKRMRDRVTEMAEERVELQKVIASFKLKEASWRARAREFEFSMCTLKERSHRSDADVGELKQSISDVCSKLKATSDELDTVGQRNQYLEMENLELQKEMLRLRRICNDQEMTIEGLCQELDEAVNGSSECKSEGLIRLQRELLRLAGVEQTLRNEMNALHAEMINLKQKCLGHNGAPVDLMRLNQELQVRVDGLQTQAITLQDENKQLSINLRTAKREKKDAEATLSMFQSSREGMEYIEGNLIPLDKDEVKENLRQRNEGSNTEEQSEDLKEEDKLHWKVINGKLQSRDLELEQLDGEIAALTYSRDSLQMEVDDLHGRLVMANQRVRELERQLGRKEEDLDVLQAHLQEHREELLSLRNELPLIRRQRDEMRKEAEDVNREVLRLTLEINDLRKVVEKLDEELMLKDGQISILRGTYGGDF